MTYDLLALLLVEIKDGAEDVLVELLIDHKKSGHGCWLPALCPLGLPALPSLGNTFLPKAEAS